MAALQEESPDFIPSLEQFGLVNRKLYLNKGHSKELIDRYPGFRQFALFGGDLSIPCNELENLINKYPASFPLLFLRTIDQLRQIPTPNSFVRNAGADLQEFNNLNQPVRLLHAISFFEDACTCIDQIDIAMSTINYFKERFDYHIRYYKNNDLMKKAIETLDTDRNGIFKQYTSCYTGVHAQLTREDYYSQITSLVNYHRIIMNMRKDGFQIPDFSLYGDNKLQEESI